ncbi:MAG TPA: PAS domain-containing protein, partial [Pseudomonas sp.]|nr:PAS domain-containing protein [Pseudomonas sp.]
PSARALESAAAFVEFAADDATALSLSDGTPARHYAAVILRDGQHRPLGTLCVLNAAVQPLPAQQARQLQTLADQVMALFELRLQREDEAGVLRDGQRQVEIAHEQSEAYVRLLLDSASEAFYSIDTEGRVTLCNEAFLRLLGFASRDEVLGRQLHDVIHHSHPDGRPYDVRDCPIHRSARSGESAHVERELFFRQDGSALPVEYRVVPVYRDGVLQGALCTFADVSERTRREALQALLLDISDRLQASSEHIDLRCVLDARLGRLTNSDGIALGHLDGDDALV